MSPEPAEMMNNGDNIDHENASKSGKIVDSKPLQEEGRKIPDVPDAIQRKASEIKSKPTSCFGSRTRHVILLIGTLCMTMLLSNILILNVTIMCMSGGSKKSPSSFVQPRNNLSEVNDAANTEINVEDSKSLEPELESEFDWSPETKTLIFSSGAVGALSAIPIAILLIRRIGTRKTFALAGMLSATATALAPLAARYGVLTLVLTRIGQGGGLASAFPVIGGMSAGWSTLKYSGVFLSLITSFVQLAPIFTMPVAGVVCTSDIGWPMVYYIHAAVTVIFFTMWAVFYKDTPLKHRWTTPFELSKITVGKPPMPAAPIPVPLLAILSSATIWVVWLTALSNFAAMQLFVIYMANFNRNSLGYSIRDASVLAILPPFVQFFAKILAGILGDRQYSCLSATSKVRVFNSIASIGSAIFLLILAFVSSTERFWSTVLLCISAFFLGFNTSGMFRSPSLVARQHTHFVMTIIQVLLCVTLLGMPFVVDFLTPSKPAKDWSLVFGAIAFFLLITNVFFCVFAKGSPAPWTVTVGQSTVTVYTIPESVLSPVPITNGASD